MRQKKAKIEKSSFLPLLICLYEAANWLYAEKEKVEQHLSQQTDELFDQKDTIILYDLTNVYFEGSEKADYGRIKKSGQMPNHLCMKYRKTTNCLTIFHAFSLRLLRFFAQKKIYHFTYSELESRHL